MVNDLFILRITSKSADVKNEIEKSQNQAHRLEIDRLKKSSKNVNRTAVIGACKSPLLAGLLPPSPEAIKMTMFQQFYAGFLFAFGLLSPRHDSRLQFLLLQNKILKAQLKSDRVVPTPEEKAELLCLGATMQDDINNLIAIVKPKTNASGANLRRLGLRCDCSTSALTCTNQHFFKPG